MEASAVGREFQAGDSLFREGEPGMEMYVIQQGTVRVSKNIDGTETVLAQLGEGEFVGELAVVRGGAHTTTATATEVTKVLVVTGPVLEDMVTEDSEIAVRFIRGLASRLAASQPMALCAFWARPCGRCTKGCRSFLDPSNKFIWLPNIITRNLSRALTRPYSRNVDCYANPSPMGNFTSCPKSIP